MTDVISKRNPKKITLCSPQQNVMFKGQDSHELSLTFPTNFLLFYPLVNILKSVKID